MIPVDGMKPPKQPPSPNRVSSLNSVTGTAIFHQMARFAILFFTISSLLHLHFVTSDVSDDEKQALLKFIQSVKLPIDSRYKWDESKPVCSSKDDSWKGWDGVTCDTGDNFVIHLRIPGASIIGDIPPETIGKLKSLRVLSLRENGLTGPLPEDFSNLDGLNHLHLNNNSFSGQLPQYFSKFVDLKTLVLNNNSFSGPLPDGLSNLKKLTQLLLSDNRFSGQLPDMRPEEFDVSNNSFVGPIPTSLSDVPRSNFSRNVNLCGVPLPPCKNDELSPPPPPPPNTATKKSKEKGVIVGVSVGSAVLLLLLLCFVKKKINEQNEQPPELPLQKPASASMAGTSTGGERNKLVFLEAGVYSFDLEDLYRASPEILGKGSFGTSYKVALDGGTTTVVVKRLKDVVVTNKEFESRMEVLGKMKNQHLIPLRAFYYSKDEKLLVYDYLFGGSLSACLHGNKGSGRTLLDWGQRMRIGLSVARGVAYLHEVGNLVHGDIKSSNILLQQEDAFVSDFGLNTLFGPNHQVRGYLAPEVLEDQKLTYESDVYSFGVLLLELLTGKAPNDALVGGDLPRWVQRNTNIRDEWKADVFDVELMRYHDVELEMVELLKIAMECVSTIPNQRPSMHDVVRKMEDMNQSDSYTPSTESYTPSTGT